MRKSAFQLNIRVEIQRVEFEEGFPQSPLYTNDRLCVDEQKSLGMLNFAQLASVLHRFFELGETVGDEFAGVEAGL